MIETISIRNFRGIDKLNLDNLGQINIIAGKNNSSKSSILEALALFLGAKDGQELFINILREILLWRGLYGEKSIEDLFYRGSKELEVSVRFFEHDIMALILKTHAVGFAGISPRIEKGIAVEFKSNGGSWRREFSRKYIFGYSNSKLKKIPQYEWIIDILTSAETTQSDFEFITSLTLMKFGYIENLYSQAYENQVLQDAIKVIQGAYPEVKSLSPIQKYNKWIIHVETKYGVYPYYVMGEGFKSALIIALLTSLLKDGYLLIDSAEAFHHPSSLEITSKMLVKCAKENKVQIFLTTHSLELIDLLLEYAKEENVDGRLIYMRREGKRLFCSVESFENAKEMRDSLGIDLRG
jgi:AAA15 family ATPase/GTPase